MFHKIIFLLSVWFFVNSCTISNKKNIDAPIKQPTDTIQLKLIDAFADSILAGKPGNNKVELLKYANLSTYESYVLMKLFDRNSQY